MGQARKGLKPRADRAVVHAQRLAGAEGGGRILSIMRAAQGLRSCKRGERFDEPAACPKRQSAVQSMLRIMGAAQQIRSAVGDRRHRFSPPQQAAEHGAAMIVVDAQHHMIGARDEPLFHRRIVVHGSMAINVVGGDVDQHADARRQRWREIDLERRTFDHMDAATRGRFKIENGRADIAAQLHIMSRLAQDMGDERSRGRFAIGAGDGHKGRIGRKTRAFATEQLDIADDFDASGLRLPHGPVGRRMRERHARRENQRGETRPIGDDQIHHRHALRHGALARGFAIIPGGHFRAARHKRARRRKP